MNLANPAMHQGLHFYISSGYPCGYLANKEAISLIAAPPHLIDTAIYSKLMQQGFRRSGLFVYKPHCENCQACVPVRLPVLDFVPNHSQKRAMKQHEALSANVLAGLRPSPMICIEPGLVWAFFNAKATEPPIKPTPKMTIFFKDIVLNVFSYADCNILNN